VCVLVFPPPPPSLSPLLWSLAVWCACGVCVGVCKLRVLGFQCVGFVGALIPSLLLVPLHCPVWGGVPMCACACAVCWCVWCIVACECEWGVCMALTLSLTLNPKPNPNPNPGGGWAASWWTTGVMCPPFPGFPCVFRSCGYVLYAVQACYPMVWGAFLQGRW
jgi:hypothetical protein